MIIENYLSNYKSSENTYFINLLISYANDNDVHIYALLWITNIIFFNMFMEINEFWNIFIVCHIFCKMYKKSSMKAIIIIYFYCVLFVKWIIHLIHSICQTANNNWNFVPSICIVIVMFIISHWIILAAFSHFKTYP